MRARNQGPGDRVHRPPGSRATSRRIRPSRISSVSSKPPYGERPSVRPRWSRRGEAASRSRFGRPSPQAKGRTSRRPGKLTSSSRRTGRPHRRVRLGGMIAADVSEPFRVAEGRGAHFTDVDGHEYLHMHIADSSAFCGHAPGPLVEAVKRQIERGNAALEGQLNTSAMLSRRMRASSGRFSMPITTSTTTARSKRSRRSRMSPR